MRSFPLILSFTIKKPLALEPFPLENAPHVARFSFRGRPLGPFDPLSFYLFPRKPPPGYGTNARAKAPAFRRIMTQGVLTLQQPPGQKGLPYMQRTRRYRLLTTTLLVLAASAASLDRKSVV